MGFLMFLARKYSLIQRQNGINYQLMSINQQLNDYTDYVSILSQDSIDATDLANLPTSLFSQGLSDLTNATLAANQMASQQFNQAMAANGLFGQANNQYIVQLTQQKLKENAFKQIQKQLQIRANQAEKKLGMKKVRLEAQLKEVETELQTIDQQIAGGIKAQISTFGLQA